MLSSSDRKILEQIIEVEGQCLLSQRCHQCPFRAMCLPEFLNVSPLSHSQRKNMAMDVISYNDILEDETALESINESRNKSKI